MELQLRDKVAIVTGAGRGIGRAIAETLANEGMRLAIASRSKPELETLAAVLPTESIILPLDLRTADSTSALIDATVARFGRIDALINNAGATKRGDFFVLNDDDWSDGFALKFFGAMRCCRAAWSQLSASKGAIVNIAGIGGRTGSRDFAIGGSVNAAVMNLTKALADRGKEDGVRVNAVNPGAIASDRLKGRVESFSNERGINLTEAETALATALAIPRFGTPNEVANLVAYLVSPTASFIQGAIVDIDGGQTLTL